MKSKYLLVPILIVLVGVGGFFVMNREVDRDVVTATSASFSEPTIYEMNDYLGFPDGNSLKTHSTCYDSELQQGYIAGIMSPEIAVFRDGEVFDYVDIEVGEGDFVIKKVFCDGGMAFVVTEDMAIKIDGGSLEIVDTLGFKKSVYSSSTILDVGNGWIAFPVPDTLAYDFYSVDDFKFIASVDMDKGKLFGLSDGGVLAIDFTSDNSGYTVKELSGTDFSVLDSYKLDGSSSIKDLVYLEEENSLWMLTTGKGEIFIFDLNNPDEKPFSLKTGVSEAHQIEYDGEYVVVLTENGFDYEGYGNYLGGIGVIDPKSMEVLYTLEMPHHHTQMDLDPVNHYAYVTNNSDNSVSQVDLVTGEELAVIKAGSSVEHGVVTVDGDVYVANRLGGNSIMHLDPETGDFNNIDTVYAWPVGTAYSENLDQVFTFDFLNSSISVIDPDTDEIVTTYETGVPDGSTDGIGDMTYDSTHDIAYVAIPEQNVVVAMDMESGEQVAVIEVEDYLKEGEKYEEIKGAGKLMPVVYEEDEILVVYAENCGKLFVYDGRENYEYMGEILIESDLGTKNFPYSLYVDQVQGLVHVGSGIYDLHSFGKIDELPYGNAIAVIDYERGVVFTVGIDENSQETLYAISADDQLLDQVDMNKNQYVKARFAYDVERGVVYAFYMVDSAIWEYRVNFD